MWDAGQWGFQVPLQSDYRAVTTKLHPLNPQIHPVTKYAPKLGRVIANFVYVVTASIETGSIVKYMFVDWVHSKIMRFMFLEPVTQGHDSNFSSPLQRHGGSVDKRYMSPRQYIYKHVTRSSWASVTEGVSQCRKRTSCIDSSLRTC